nr:MAG TPA: hypothetical protein [Caudoviricetes sp.]
MCVFRLLILSLFLYCIYLILQYNYNIFSLQCNTFIVLY